MHPLRRSLLFSFLDRYVTVAINLVLTAVVARLMSPAEIGLFTVGAGLVLMMEAFRDFGTTAYLVQERSLTPEIVRTAFTVTLAISVLLALAVWLLAGPAAAFYGEDGLGTILRVAGLAFLFAPFGNVAVALLRREMAFDRIALIGAGGTVANAVTVVTLAVLGCGPVSLAWGLAVTTCVRSLAAALPCRARLGMFRPCLAGWRKVCAFGGWASGTVLLNSFCSLLPSLSLGRILGFDAVGLYSRATLLCQLPDGLILSALQPVLLPALAARVRLGGDLKQPYLRGLCYGLTLQWPFLICLALLADPVVRLLLGEPWAATAPLARLMALASLALFPAFLTYPVLVAVGRVRDTLIASLISLPPSLSLLVAAAFVGLEAVAASLFLTAPFQVYVALRLIRRQIPFTAAELLDAVRPGVAAALCAAAAPAAAVALSGFRLDLPVTTGIAAGLGGAAGWLIGLLLVDHPLLHEIPAAARLNAALREHLRRIVRRRRAMPAQVPGA